MQPGVYALLYSLELLIKYYFSNWFFYFTLPLEKLARMKTLICIFEAI